jgi:hypothetical protein
MSNEIWRTVNVEGIPLAVSNLGRVKKLLPRERELAPFRRVGSCAYVRIYTQGEKHTLRSVARLVVQAFINAPNLPQHAALKYRDHNPLNCSVENLIIPAEYLDTPDPAPPHAGPTSPDSLQE